MARIKNSDGKSLKKSDMVSEMIRADHRKTKHYYFYYLSYYIYESFTYDEISYIYLNEFKN